MIRVNASKKELICEGKTYPCAIGKDGYCIAEEKQEGDGKTPLGTYALRELFYRGDKFEAVPVTLLPVKRLHENDGWCDEPGDLKYNKYVTLPYSASHEELFRDDDVYDLIIPLGYNDNPPVAGKGSAIFMHVAKEGYTPTEGCVALKKEDLLEVLFNCTPNTQIEITEQ
jgi:L,D-peptidoglycan transpeptidase YkuD (ErfK/YbiS/YcfS/YnhG family)